MVLYFVRAHTHTQNTKPVILHTTGFCSTISSALTSHCFCSRNFSSQLSYVLKGGIPQQQGVASKKSQNHEGFHDPSSFPLLYHQEDGCCNFDCGLAAFPGPLTVITPGDTGARRDRNCSSYLREFGFADYYYYYYYYLYQSSYCDGGDGAAVDPQNLLPYEMRTLHDTLPSNQVCSQLKQVQEV